MAEKSWWQELNRLDGHIAFTVRKQRVNRTAGLGVEGWGWEGTSVIYFLQQGSTF